jgi:hypothetical protein
MAAILSEGAMRLTFCLAACATLCAASLSAQANFADENGTSHPITHARACASPKIEMVDAQLTGVSADGLPKDYMRHLDDAVFFYFSPVAWRTPRFAEAQFMLHRDGSVSGTHFVTASGMADFDSALTAAIASGGAAKAFPRFAPSMTADTVTVSAFVGRHADGTDKAYVEKRTTCPAWPVTGNPQPEYPPDLKHQNVRGFVRVQFMVDEHGVPDSASMQVLQTSAESFTNAVRAVLPSLRYQAASVEGTKVRQLTEQTFLFGFVENLPPQ